MNRHFKKNKQERIRTLQVRDSRSPKFNTRAFDAVAYAAVLEVMG